MPKFLLLAAVIALAQAGCTSPLVGTWSGSEVAAAAAGPEAKAKFEEDSFSFKQLVFQEGNKYVAAARANRKNLFLNGTYDFNGRTLTLKSDGRPDRVFSAVVWWGRELRLSSPTYKQVLRKQ